MGGCGSKEAAEQPVAQKPVEPVNPELEAQKIKDLEEKKKKEEAAAEEARLQREAKAAADRAEKEANEAAALAIANQLAADLAEKKIEEARLAALAATEQQEHQIMESFKSMGAKLRFRAAVKEGKMDVAKDAAACMLQGTWRSKCARRKMAQKKAEARHLMEEGQARKLQSLYRCRLSRKKVTAKREEKRQVLAAEEARLAAVEAARLVELRSAEEARLQREAKAAADRAEKEANEAAALAIANQLAADLAEKKIEEARLAALAATEQQEHQIMESFKSMGAKLRFRAAVKEGKMDVAKDAAACMLQGTWRSKCARRKMVQKKAEARHLMEEGQARKLQSLYRCRLSRKKVAAKREEKRQVLAAEEARLAERESKIEEITVELVDISPDLMKGFIKKEGQFVRTTKNRFFVLRTTTSDESVLSYYVSEKAREPFGDDLKGSVSMKNAKLSNPDLKLNMTLTGADGRELKMKFYSAVELDSWRTAMQAHLLYSNKKVQIVGQKLASL
jgi:hypothetical protein